MGVTVEGPCEAEIQCTDKGDGTCAVTYLPIKAGTYKVNVLYDNQHVPGSPFNGKLKQIFLRVQIHKNFYINNSFLLLIFLELKVK